MNRKYILGFALIASGLVAGQVNLTQSLTACYALDGNGAEPINNLTATLSAVTPTVDRFSNASSALTFYGTAASHIELPASPLIKPTNAFSFSCWVTTSTLTDQYILMTKNPAGSNFEAYSLHLGVSGGQLRVIAKKGDGFGGTTVVTGTTALSTNTWYHFAVTIDNSSMNVYTNGTLDATGSVGFPFSYQANKNVILGGSNEPTFNLPFMGTMDNLRFYNRVITAGEVTQLFLTDPACVNPTSTPALVNPVEDIKIFPNPSPGKFKVNSKKEIGGIEVYDVLGRFVINLNNSTEIELSDKPNGVYFVKLKINNEFINYKIIKE